VQIDEGHRMGIIFVIHFLQRLGHSIRATVMCYRNLLKGFDLSSVPLVAGGGLFVSGTR
jgi:hypothetical protein